MVGGQLFGAINPNQECTARRSEKLEHAGDVDVTEALG